VRAAEAFNSEAMAGYRSAVQNAFAEVENALIGYQKTGEQTDAQQKQVTSLRRYLELSVQRYDEGQSSYLEVLDAQRNLFGALLALSETEGAHLSQFTALYRALGGAWVARAETPENEPARKSNWIF
jgi:multidrug efflux system outer membrane protein